MPNNKPRKVRRPPTATNKWDSQQRTTLHVLCTHFNNLGWPLVTKAFGVLFKEHLQSRGLPNGLPEKALRAQYREHRFKPAVWASICADPATDEEWRRRNELTTRIRAVLNVIETGAPPPVAGLAGRRRQSALDIVEEAPRTPTKRLSHFEHAEPTAKRMKTISNRTRSNASPDFAGALTNTSPASSVAEQPSTRRAVNDNMSGTGPSTSVAVSVRVAVNGRHSARVQPTEPPTSTPKTPRKSPRSEQQLQEYARLNAPTLKLTADEIARTKLPLLPVPDALAHPPASGLLYRYWDENSYGRNSETGFVAGRFMHNNLTPRPAPRANEMDDTDIENHLDRNKVASPFCSASNCLLWIMRLALHEARNDAKQGKITLVDVEALPAGSVYHVKPFHKRIKSRYCFKNGAWRYCGTHEFIIWHEIPRKAIIHTFAIVDLLDACDTTLAFAAMLRVDTVGRNLAALKTTTVARLEEAGIALTPETVTVIARLCKFVGLTARSPLKQLEHLVTDIIQGWRLLISPLSPAEWTSLANTFTHVLCGRSSVPTLERNLQLQMAFLHAVKGGLGEFNMMFDPILIRRMQKKACIVGLEDPRGIVMASVASAAAAVGEYEREQEARYTEAIGARRLLASETAERLVLESDVESSSGADLNGDAVDRADEVDGEDDEEIMYDEDMVGL
ncbi:hypothetical protein LTR33_001721 [Friedmanniomyces endolithicus]|nr:hypothetical protein LTR33_001721 [Friedmanniomyces endolithicus]